MAKVAWNVPMRQLTTSSMRVARTITALFIALIVSAIFSGATTLQRLSMTEMVQKSTSILRAKVTGKRAAFRGQDIYTYYQLQASETLKAGPAVVELAVPGGVVGGLQQIGIGSPELAIGGDYVIFLWTSPSGLTQIIGLSQGLFVTGSGTDPILTRASIGEAMVDSNGHPAQDTGVSIRLSALRTLIQQAGTAK